jgi:hypothetical protein
VPSCKHGQLQDATVCVHAIELRHYDEGTPTRLSGECLNIIMLKRPFTHMNRTLSSLFHRLFDVLQGEGRKVALSDPNSKSGKRVAIGIESETGDPVENPSCLPPEAHAEGRRLGHGPLYTSTMTQLQPHPPEHKGNRGRDAGEGCSVACQDCGVLVPALNRQLHSLRCHGADLQIRARRGGQVLSPPRPPNRQTRQAIKDEIV